MGFCCFDDLYAWFPEDARVNRTEGKDFPLKLVVHWANEGEEIHLGRPRWIAKQVSYQGQRIGQGLAYRFRVNPEHGKDTQNVRR